MKTTLFLVLFLCAVTARAEATLFILYGGAGQSYVAPRSLVVTSGPDGSIDLYDVREDTPSKSARRREDMPNIPTTPGTWSWRLHSKAGTTTGGGQCTGHTEQRTGTDGGGVFIWLDCQPVANAAVDP